MNTNSNNTNDNNSNIIVTLTIIISSNKLIGPSTTLSRTWETGSAPELGRGSTE